ncbi:hypothetical protein B8W95_14105, partial [Staphylococcus pasteuri]
SRIQSHSSRFGMWMYWTPMCPPASRTDSQFGRFTRTHKKKQERTVDLFAGVDNLAERHLVGAAALEAGQ